MGPLPLVTAALLLGLLAAWPSPSVALAAGTALAAAGLALRGRSSLAGPSLLLAAWCAGAVYAPWTSAPSLPRRPVRAELRVRGQVARGCVATPRGGRCLVARDDGGGAWMSFPPGRCDALPGDVIEAVATVRPIVPRRNPPLLDRGARDVLAGITERWDTARCVTVGRRRDPVAWARRGAVHLRARIERGLGAVLQGADRERARALLFGDTRALDEGDVEAFRETGMAHLLAVSGAHVMLLAGALAAIARALLRRVPWIALRGWAPALSALLPLPAVAAFVMVTGESASARRALYTALLTALAAVCGRRADPRAVLAAVALGMALADPSVALDLGWQLSVIATWALVSRPAEPEAHARARAWPDRALASVRAALSATLRVALSLTPLLAWQFGRAPLTAVIGNLVAAPLGEALALPLTLVTALVAAVAPSVAAPFAWLSGRALALLFVVPGVARELPLASVALPTPTPAQWITLTAATLAMWPWGWRVRARLALAALLALGAMEGAHRRSARPRGVLRVTVLDVGQGDAVLVDLPDGEAMLIDGGGALHGEDDPGRAVVVPWLRLHRRERLASVVLSHPHPDHAGGLRAVLDAVRVDSLWDTSQGALLGYTGTYAALLDAARRHRVTVRAPASLCGTRAFHGATLDVLAPCPAVDPETPANDASFVIRLGYGRASVLLPGDLEMHGEKALIPRLGPVTALKVPHHGSRTSSTVAFLRALRPRVALVSSGHPSPFGHPHDEVVARYRALGISLRRTDLDGVLSVTLRPDGTVR